MLPKVNSTLRIVPIVCTDHYEFGTLTLPGAKMEWVSWIWESTKHILGAIGIRTAADVIAAIAGPILAIYVYRLARWVRRSHVAEQRIRRALGAVAKQDGPYGRIEGKGIWLTAPVQHPNGYPGWFARGLPTLVIANLKGYRRTIDCSTVSQASQRRKLVCSSDFWSLTRRRGSLN